MPATVEAPRKHAPMEMEPVLVEGENGARAAIVTKQPVSPPPMTRLKRKSVAVWESIR